VGRVSYGRSVAIFGTSSTHPHKRACVRQRAATTSSAIPTYARRAVRTIQADFGGFLTMHPDDVVFFVCMLAIVAVVFVFAVAHSGA
jgi:hypothetical protein